METRRELEHDVRDFVEFPSPSVSKQSGAKKNVRQLRALVPGQKQLIQSGAGKGWGWSPEEEHS